MFPYYAKLLIGRLLQHLHKTPKSLSENGETGAFETNTGLKLVYVCSPITFIFVKYSL